MNRLAVVSFPFLVLACTNNQHGLPYGGEPDAAQIPLDAILPDGDTATTTDAMMPATCNGYEPCGVNAVILPTGYTLRNYVDFDDYGSYGSCTTWEDCGMWNSHYTSNYVDGNTGQPVAQYYNRMSSPFPWAGSRYEIDVAPKKIQYAAFHIMAPNDPYKFSDGTLETRTDRATGAITCFKRGPGHM